MRPDSDTEPSFSGLRFLFELSSATVKRNRSDADYQAFQRVQASRVIQNAMDLLGVKPGMTALDFGCGTMGYSMTMAKLGLHVTAVDFSIPAAAIEGANGQEIRHFEADLREFRDQPVDFVFCASVIEHIEPASRGRFLQAIRENLRPGGKCYLSFPPFLSPIGGHSAAPFHYLPDRLAFALARLSKGVEIPSYEKMWGTWGLYRTGVEEIEAALRSAGFEILETRSRYLPAWYSRLFFKNGVLNWHAEFFCSRP